MGSVGAQFILWASAVAPLVVLAEEAPGPLPVIPEPSAWNDTACHSVSA